jgi:8-oxo-dGTP pyrophosphatase MutT (NUDIX family)
VSEQAERLLSVRQISARLVSHDWSFVARHAADIAGYWRQRTAEKPAMFNGKVLMQCNGHVAGDSFHAEYFQLDYASMVAWHAMGCPQTDGFHIRNGFALGALRSRDGAHLMGVMGQHTHNAGKVYFPGGTPDDSDVKPDGTVDLAGSVLRELEEETGLSPHDVGVGDTWQVAPARERVAFLRDIFIDLPAVEARALIRDRLSRQAEPEFDDIVIVRSAADIDAARMPLFMQIFLAQAFTT